MVRWLNGLTIRWRFIWTRVRWVLLLAPLAWVSVLPRTWNIDSVPNGATDSDAYWLARDEPYAVTPEPGPVVFGVYPYYLYPPTLSAVISLAGTDRRDTHRLMVGVGIVGAFALAVALSRLAGVSGWPTLLALHLLYAWAPSVRLVRTGNVQMAVDAMAVWALTLSPVGATFLLSLAVVTKPGAWLALAVVLARTRAVTGAALAGGLAIGLTMIAYGLKGPGLWLQWLTKVVPSVGQGEIGGYSFGTWNLSPTAWLGPLSLLLPLIAAYLTRRFPWNVQAGWVLVAASLSAPILRAGYLSILLVIPALLWRRTKAPREGAGPLSVPAKSGACAAV